MTGFAAGTSAKIHLLFVQSVDQFFIGFSASVFNSHLVFIQVFEPENAELLKPFETQ
ncbi:MAG TPA: hypothetical protein VKH81_11590 [Candidatus Angelobacter sp.]|nr:hypothetical protein [Candidatus Angelobacter sp.]